MALFLAHSIELESEARQRYLELAEAMEVHNNLPTARFFQRMVAEAQQHLEEVAALAQGLQLPDLAAWEFHWPGAEAPESASYEALHYRMSPRQAMELALANECAARDYYDSWARSTADPETRDLATRFAAEEQGHADLLQALIDGEGDTAALQQEDDDPPHMPE